MGHFVWNVIIGLVVGAVAKLLMPGRQGGGIIVTALLGMVGAVVATFVGQQLHFYEPDQGAGFIASVVGAIIVVWIYGMITRKSDSSSSPSG
jgi:uncharacterized membrane protein YeaQ/YmgE (transglycosylase-associated protein family)